MKRQNYIGYMFIAPILGLFLIFIVYPIVYNLWIGFYEWNGIDREKAFIGIQNYIEVLNDPVMWIAVRNFCIFALVTILVQALMGLLFAVILRNKMRFAQIYRTLIYLPIIATPVVVGQIFSKIFETNRGYLNGILRAVHLDGLCRQWLAEPKIALGCVIFVNIWQWTGYSMLLYYTNMLNIPGELYEAAKIDGAGGWTQFTKITFPLLRGTHYTIFIMGMIGSLKTFDIPYVLTAAGPNHATEFFSTYIYSMSFDLFKQGEASAIVMVMFLIAMIITAVQLYFYYKGDKDKELC